MSEWVKLTASDGHELDAYVAQPEGEPQRGRTLRVLRIGLYPATSCSRYRYEGSRGI